MAYKVDNAVIMAAGASSRFAPLSYEMPKALIPVRGEVLIERQIRQLQEAGVPEIIVVTGYKHECFDYLADKFHVKLVHNPEYHVRNNHSSIYAVRNYLHNSYICSSDNYFTKNPFETEVDDAYYAAVYADGETREWCMESDPTGYVNRVQSGGRDAWYMLGHVFWNEAFTQKFLRILEQEYDLPETADKLWEAIYMEHLDELKLRIRKYDADFIFEFDSLDELRAFDPSYCGNTRSAIIKQLAAELGCSEADLNDFTALKAAVGTEAVGFTFRRGAELYRYLYAENKLEKDETKHAKRNCRN